ncbi:radical SAM protein [Bacillus sp. E(2018)]|uniref:biotin synthase BioB n=1 Tax=Bacillus sp. E(2018) TaxID=2502239 RepID=UPI0010F82DDD|nr:radical SAM protein [Bacillus sp. E(2018)]
MLISEIVENLQLTGKSQQDLFQRAREARRNSYNDRAVLRGVIEVTNICRVNCDYCPMRRDNMKNNDTYILDNEELILNTVREIKANGINIVFFQGGETNKTTKLIGEIIPKVRKIYNDDVEILLNLGIKKKEEYEYLFAQGATSYILKHETSNEQIHQKLRHEPLGRRIQAIEDLLSTGFKVGTGMITGLPDQTVESVAEDILLAKNLGVHMCSVSPFVPAPNTPLSEHLSGDNNIALNAIAIMRLLSPHWLIPSVSAMEKNLEGGQQAGFNAGANVMTINFTPPVQSDKYLIYGKDRFVVKTDYAKQTLKSVGLKPCKSIFSMSKSLV